MARKELEMRKLVRESDVIDKTDGSELARAFNYLWEKYIEQEPCDDAISRKEAIRIASGYCHYTNIPKELEKLPSVHLEANKGHCKDCKWWKDSDGMFRRGIDAESQCPMNRIEVYEGTGYCFMFEPRDGE